MVERISQQISAENDQFRRDMQRCLVELTFLPFFQQHQGLIQSMLFSFVESRQEDIPQQQTLPQGSLPKETVKIPPQQQIPKDEPKRPSELSRKERQKKNNSNK